MSNRHFTRQEVDAFIREMHIPADGCILEIKSIAVLRNASLPLWLVEHEMVCNKGKPFEVRTSLIDIITEKVLKHDTHLWPLIAQEIPDGCSTVAEEDAAVVAAR